MTVRTRYRLGVFISSSSAEERDLANLDTEVVSDDFGEGGVRKFTLISTASDVQVDIGNIATGRFLAIRTNSADPTLDPVEVEVKRNSTGGEIWPITPMDSTREGHLLTSTSGLTALFMSNPGAVDMEITVYTAGD